MSDVSRSAKNERRLLLCPFWAGPVRGASHDLVVERLQIYYKLSEQDWPPESNLLPASVIW